MPTNRPLPVDPPILVVDPTTAQVALTTRGIVFRTPAGPVLLEPAADADRWDVRSFWRELELHVAGAYSRA